MNLWNRMVIDMKYSTTLISLPRNEGKGAALAAAINRINDTNALILTTDADGSAEVACLEVLYDTMVATLQHKNATASNPPERSWTDPAIVCGYRTYSDTAPGRLLFRWGFRTVVRLVCGDLGTRDSQCGFKLMTVAAAKQLYRNLHLTRWSHDVEVLYRAKLLNFTVTESPVKWQDVDGSKLKAEGILKVASRMFVDVCRCRLYYALGLWDVDQKI
jgi:dolichyl-phosphate beta-glucosyltransferase